MDDQRLPRPPRARRWNSSFIHLSDEDGKGWTTIAVNRETRQCSIAREGTQSACAEAACESLYEAD